GEVRDQTAFNRVHFGVARVDDRQTTGDLTVGRVDEGQRRAGVASFGIKTDGVQRKGRFAARTGDSGRVPPQRLNAGVGSFTRIGATSATGRLLLQVEGASEGRCSDRSHEDSKAANACHVPGSHVIHL